MSARRKAPSTACARPLRKRSDVGQRDGTPTTGSPWGGPLHLSVERRKESLAEGACIQSDAAEHGAQSAVPALHAPIHLQRRGVGAAPAREHGGLAHATIAPAGTAHNVGGRLDTPAERPCLVVGRPCCSRMGWDTTLREGGQARTPPNRRTPRSLKCSYLGDRCNVRMASGQHGTCASHS